MDARRVRNIQYNGILQKKKKKKKNCFLKFIVVKIVGYIPYSLLNQDMFFLYVRTGSWELNFPKASEIKFGIAFIVDAFLRPQKYPDSGEILTVA